jgi:hypothetical protein
MRDERKEKEAYLEKYGIEGVLTCYENIPSLSMCSIIYILVKEYEGIFTQIRGEASEETKDSEFLPLLVKIKEVQGLRIINITSNLTANTDRMETSTSLERSDSCESNTGQKVSINIVINLERKHKELEAKYTKLQNAMIG